MKNKWRFFAVTLAVVLCMTVFSVTAVALQKNKKQIENRTEK